MTQDVQTVSQARTGPMPTGGQWGWYQDHEGREFRRVSTLIKKVETDTYSLDLWKQRQVAEGLALRDDLALALKAMGRPGPDGWSKQDKDKINGIVKDAMQAAKQRDGARAGTAMHDLTERVDRGELIDDVVRGLPAAAAQSLRAYAFLRRENGWRTVEVERTVVCDELECAGTFDRVDLVPGLAALLGPGTCQYGHTGDHAGTMAPGGELPVINDVKTETAPWLNGLHIGPQLAIYSRAQRMWRATGGMVPLLDRDGKQKTYPRSGDPIMIPAGEYVPAPCVRQDVAIVTHVFDGEAVPYFINLTEGWEAAQAAAAQMSREFRAKRKLGTAGAWFAAVPNVTRPAVAQILVEQAAAANYAGVRPEHRVGAGVGAQQSYRRADGMVDWAPGAEAAVGSQVTVAGVEFVKVDTMANVVSLGALDTVDRQAIETIWAGVDTAAIGKVWDIYVNTIGRPWEGRVAEAGTARRAMVECVQRALHAGSGKCACGWDGRFQP